MPLSEHEQRILAEIERRLAEEDPKFARAATAVTPRGVAVRRLKRAAAGFVIGFGLLIAGMAANQILWFGLAAFGVMLASVAVISRTAKEIGRSAVSSSNTGTPRWLGRFEERWRKRFERGDRS